jgi:hypothetical protein
MAEQEIIKHTKNLFNISARKDDSFLNKVKDFVLEILIIVFAITLSIWLHNWSEHRSEQRQVKIFLTGLKGDIAQDLADCRNIIASLHYYDTAYTFLSNLTADKRPDQDSLHQFVQILRSNNYLQPHKSRFDGFISSGKMLQIESDSLVNNILLYYQEGIPAIRASEGGWLSYQSTLLKYLVDNMKEKESDEFYYQLLAAPEGNYLCQHLIPWQQMYDRYRGFMSLGQTIISQIDKEYPEK